MNLLIALLILLAPIKAHNGCLYAIGFHYDPQGDVFEWETLMDSTHYQVMYRSPEWKAATDVVWANHPGGFGGPYSVKSSLSGPAPAGVYDLVDLRSTCVLESLYFAGEALDAK